MPIQIHGKTYITVAERVQEAGDDFIALNTEVLYQTPVVIKATVTTKKGVFTGISAANPSKAIEKMSPYEVAETSAIGRALGFAGYGIVDGIATADEMAKATNDPTADWAPDTEYTPQAPKEVVMCPEHNVEYRKFEKNGRTWYSHSLPNNEWCNRK